MSYKVAVADAVVAWLLTPAASVRFPTFEAPGWVLPSRRGRRGPSGGAASQGQRHRSGCEPMPPRARRRSRVHETPATGWRQLSPSIHHKVSAFRRTFPPGSDPWPIPESFRPRTTSSIAQKILHRVEISKGWSGCPSRSRRSGERTLAACWFRHFAETDFKRKSGSSNNPR